jgi:hypothetical protein
MIFILIGIASIIGAMAMAVLFLFFVKKVDDNIYGR